MNFAYSIWNGMYRTVNCLLFYPDGGDPNNACPAVGPTITDYVPPTMCGGLEITAELDKLSGNNSIFARQAASCSVPPDGGDGISISVTNGPTAGPTCASQCGGIVCSGYWCTPDPTGYPPGYLDPKDPNSGATAPPTTVTQGFGTGTTPPTSFPLSTTIVSVTSPVTSSLPTSTNPSPTTAPVATNTYNIFLWNCPSSPIFLNEFTFYGAAAAGGTTSAEIESEYCDSGNNIILASLDESIESGDMWTVCGLEQTSDGFDAEGALIVDQPAPQLPGLCIPLEDQLPIPCDYPDSSDSCKVTGAYSCNIVICP